MKKGEGGEETKINMACVILATPAQSFNGLDPCTGTIQSEGAVSEWASGVCAARLGAAWGGPCASFQ
jgi:hypothetical protein